MDETKLECSNGWVKTERVTDERKSVKLTINIHNRGELTINAHEARTTTPLFYCWNEDCNMEKCNNICISCEKYKGNGVKQ